VVGVGRVVGGVVRVVDGRVVGVVGGGVVDEVDVGGVAESDGMEVLVRNEIQAAVAIVFGVVGDAERETRRRRVGEVERGCDVVVVATVVAVVAMAAVRDGARGSRQGVGGRGRQGSKERRGTRRARFSSDAAAATAAAAAAQDAENLLGRQHFFGYLLGSERERERAASIKTSILVDSYDDRRHHAIDNVHERSRRYDGQVGEGGSLDEARRDQRALAIKEQVGVALAQGLGSQRLGSHGTKGAAASGIGGARLLHQGRHLARERERERDKGIGICTLGACRERGMRVACTERGPEMADIR